jgi:threonine 3-dehydrogenase
MKALVKDREEPGLWLRDVDIPEIGIDDVLIRVRRTGICGTDLHIYAWDEWAQRTVPTPMVIGHEFVGEIVRMGSNVRNLEFGDLVSGEGHIVCGSCRNCMAGRRHLCAHTRGLGVERPGAFAEYVALPKANVWHHRRDIDLDTAAIFDPLGNAVHTATAFSVLGEDVLVTGAGPIGVMAAAVARHAGARHVVVTDVNPRRLALAERVGATRVVNVTEERLADIQCELGMEEGFDVGLEMSGSSAALRDMIAQMCHGGRIALLGIPAEDVAIDLNTIVFNGLTLRGIYGREMYETWYSMTVMVQCGLDVTPVITHRYRADNYATAFATAVGGGAGKVILDWEAL